MSLSAQCRFSSFKMDAMWRGQTKSQGFSLLELLFVVSILLILMAIALPNLMGSKKAAEEAAAAERLRVVNYACTIYKLTYGNYPPSLVALGPPGDEKYPSASHADLIDLAIVLARKNGYRILYVPLAEDLDGNVQNYVLVAQPEKAEEFYKRMFCSGPAFGLRADCRVDKLGKGGEILNEDAAP